MKGKVKYWNEIEGKGVIKPLKKRGDFIFKYGDIEEEGYRSVEEGEIVEFEGKKGKAYRVKKLITVN